MADRSARSRPPTTGRSNAPSSRQDFQNGSNDVRKHSTGSERARSSRAGSIPMDTARLEVLNDPIEVFRPYSPDGRIFDGHKRNPPVLRISDPLLPDYNTGRRSYSRPLTCPKEWIDKLQQPDILDKSSFITDIEDGTKVKMCRSFVDRNRDRLWKFDSNNYKKTPRTVANEILQDPYFVTRMTKNMNKERMYKLSNSENTAEILTDSSDIRVISDPYATSLTTSRDVRKERMESALQPALLQYGRKFQRGYDHAIDFGNFSKYNGVLKVNQATTMNR